MFRVTGYTIDRFWSLVEKTDTCWNWNGNLTLGGYGCFLGCLAYRIAYELCIGQIPRNKELDHLCRNRACVNPSHLESVSHQTNQLRGYGVSGINARKIYCIHGHEFTKENTYYRLNGKRNCKTCQGIIMRQKRSKLLNIDLREN